MSHRLIHRSVALSLAALVTFTMLASIDQLALKDEQPAQWAQRSAPRA